MPEAERDDRPDPRFIVRQASLVARGLIAGDRKLLRASLDRLARGGRWPADPRGAAPPRMLSAANIAAKLRYVYGLDKQNRVFFGLLGKKDIKLKIADVRLDLEVVPAAEPFRPTGGPARLVTALPDFVADAPGSDDGITLALTSGAAWRASDAMLASDERWLPGELIELLETFAAWLRQPGYGAQRTLRTAGANDRLGRLLGAVVDSFGLLERELTEVPVPRASTARPWDDLVRDYAAGYRYGGLRARILVKLDKRGALIEDAGESDRQQLDVEATLAPGTEPPRIDLRLRIPDFLVPGNKYFDTFAAFFGRDPAAAMLHERGGGEAIAGRDAFRRFLQDPQTRARSMFVRAATGEVDVDYVLFDGRAGTRRVGLLFRAELKVKPFPDIEITSMEKADLVAVALPGRGWAGPGGGDLRQDHLDELTRYFRRLLTVLRDWRLRGEALP